MGTKELLFYFYYNKTDSLSHSVDTPVVFIKGFLTILTRLQLSIFNFSNFRKIRQDAVTFIHFPKFENSYTLSKIPLLCTLSNSACTTGCFAVSEAENLALYSIPEFFSQRFARFAPSFSSKDGNDAVIIFLKFVFHVKFRLQ